MPAEAPAASAAPSHGPRPLAAGGPRAGGRPRAGAAPAAAAAAPSSGPRPLAGHGQMPAALPAGAAMPQPRQQTAGSRQLTDLDDSDAESGAHPTELNKMVTTLHQHLVPCAPLSMMICRCQFKHLTVSTADQLCLCLQRTSLPRASSCRGCGMSSSDEGGQPGCADG